MNVMYAIVSVGSTEASLVRLQFHLPRSLAAVKDEWQQSFDMHEEDGHA